MIHSLTKKARGYCPHLSRDHSIRIEGIATANTNFKKEGMNCTHSHTCGLANNDCPIYQKV